MSIQNVPEAYLTTTTQNVELFVYDFKMTADVVKSKINLGLHMFSFLQNGKKQVHFADTSVAVNTSQSLLIKKGNCLWTELLEQDEIYYCKLFFFTDSKLKDFLKKFSKIGEKKKEEIPFFIIKNDDYIAAYLNSLNATDTTPSIFNDTFLTVKFEELLMYLISKYGEPFELYLHSLVSKEESSFTKVIEKNTYSNLKLEEIAFLCNMSLSTFKRNFIREFGESPGKWLQNKRLLKAKDLLQLENKKASDIYLDLGYNNLSNFSSAFKNKFGFSPNSLLK